MGGSLKTELSGVSTQPRPEAHLHVATGAERQNAREMTHLANMHLEYLTLSSSSAAVEISTDSNGGRVMVKMHTRVLEPRRVYTDSEVDVKASGIIVWVHSQGDDDIDVPEDSIGAIYCHNRCRASVAIAPPQFEKLQNAVLLGAQFEIHLTVDAKQKPSGSETILYTEAFGKLRVLEVTFTAESSQQTQAARDELKPRT